MNSSKGSTELWDPFPLNAEQCFVAAVGALRLWVRFSKSDWYVGHRVEKVASGPAETGLLDADAPLPDVEWKRWASGNEGAAVRLSPRMPDRPVVVKPEMIVRIPAGHRATFFVSLPIFIRVSVGNTKTVDLIELPTVILSNSWFGDVTSGELCYALKTRATRDLHVSELRGDRATCAVRVYNSTPSEIELQRLCIHVEHLRIYRGMERLYTNAVSATYRGTDQLGQIEYGKAPPDYEPDCRLIQAERVPADHGLARRTFQAIRSWTGV